MMIIGTWQGLHRARELDHLCVSAWFIQVPNVFEDESAPTLLGRDPRIEARISESGFGRAESSATPPRSEIFAFSAWRVSRR